MPLRSPILALLLLSAGCGTVRLEYEADVEVEDGREGTLYYERSYDLGGHQVACALTAIFYGGWCWAYLAMPFDEQEARIRRDALDYAEDKAKAQVSFGYGRARRVSFEDEKRRATLRLQGEKDAKAKAKQTFVDGEDDEVEDDERPARKRRALRENGLKFLFPSVFGAGLAGELVDHDALSFELGAGVMLFTSYSGFYAAAKGAAHKTESAEVRAGVVHMRYSDHGGELPLSGLVLEYARRGFGVEYMHFPRRRPFGCVEACGTDVRPEGVLMVTHRPN